MAQIIKFQVPVSAQSQAHHLLIEDVRNEFCEELNDYEEVYDVTGFEVHFTCLSDATYSVVYDFSTRSKPRVTSEQIVVSDEDFEEMKNFFRNEGFIVFHTKRLE